MKKINAVILNQPILEREILFTKVKKYIETSLKVSGVSNIYYADSLATLETDTLICDALIIIKDIAPEIVEYDKLIQSFNGQVSCFATVKHNHSHEIETDSLNIYITSNFSDLENCKDAEQVLISDVVLCDSTSDLITLSEDFKFQINSHLIDHDVYILDPQSTYISSCVLIESGTQILPNTIIRGNTKIGKDCVIGPNSVIENCQIGENVKINNSQASDSTIGSKTTVGPFAYIRPDSEIGENVKIGDFVEIKKAKLGEGTKVSHLTYIGDATVGKNVNFGCGTVVVNYDGFKKYHTVVEDNAFIGCNTNLVSPVKVSKGAITAAGSTITQDIPEDSLAISRAKQENKLLWAKKFREIKSKK